MDEVVLRPAEPGDVAHFHDHESDPEALRRANFPARDRETFVAHWERNIFGVPTVRASAVVVDGKLAGNIVAWWQEGRRFVGYWLASARPGRQCH